MRWNVISRRVVNASPLIYLTHVGLLDVLNEPGVPTIVPDVVLGEIGIITMTGTSEAVRFLIP